MATNGTHIPSQLCAPLTSPPGTAGPGATTPVGRWRRFVAAIPLRFALLATAAVWAMGCVWSFREQALFAQVKGFHLPWLLPAVIDGLAIALACVAYAASLDGRPGVVARLGTAVAVAASAASNATFAWQRSGDPTTVVIAAGVPVAANLAFEVLLHELRRQVLRRRGLPAPAAVPYPRLIRVVLAPCSTLRQWRRLVLDLTALQPALHTTNAAANVAAPDAPALAPGAPASACRRQRLTRQHPSPLTRQHLSPPSRRWRQPAPAPHRLTRQRRQRSRPGWRQPIPRPRSSPALTRVR